MEKRFDALSDEEQREWLEKATNLVSWNTDMIRVVPERRTEVLYGTAVYLYEVGKLGNVDV